MDITREAVLEAVQKYGTGGQPQTESFGTEIYGEIYLEPLDGIQAVRKTVLRFEQFDIANEVVHSNVLEVGSHIGSLSFFCHSSLIARSVVGVEINKDRMNTANMIAKFNGIPKEKLQFVSEIPDHQMYGVVICCSVDDYVLDKEKFYETLMEKCGGVLVLESNIQIYDTHPFAKFCMDREINYQWIGEAIDKYPYGKDRVRNIFKVYKK